MPEHVDIAAGERHAPHNWEYANQAAREAASGFAAGDVGKLARQTDNNSFWMLTNHSPAAWAWAGGNLSTLAPLASPALTGTPTAPTAAGGTNTTQIATTAFVAAAIAALINSAPGALDTLDELAAALGDDADFAATITTALAGKQPLDATLTALAALATAADKLIYATGSDAFSTTDLTGFARTLIACVDAAAARSALGVDAAGAGGAVSSVFGRTGAVVLTASEVDGSTLEVSGGAAQVKDAGITAAKLASGLRLFTLNFVIDGGGAAITSGIKGDLRIDFACEIVGVALLADQSGSIVVDLWKDTFANFPPTNADSICASAKPTLSSQNKIEDTTLTGWTKTINAGDILRVNVDSATTIQRVTIAIKVQR